MHFVVCTIGDIGDMMQEGGGDSKVLCERLLLTVYSTLYTVCMSGGRNVGNGCLGRQEDVVGSILQWV